MRAIEECMNELEKISEEIGSCEREPTLSERKRWKNTIRESGINKLSLIYEFLKGSKPGINGETTEPEKK